VTIAKIDPPLEEELARAEAEGKLERPIPVLIEHVKEAELPPPARAQPLEEVEERVRTSQDALVQRLRELGARDVQRATLANAVSAALTPSAIRDVAARSDVKVIRLNREEQVTAG